MKRIALLLALALLTGCVCAPAMPALAEAAPAPAETAAPALPAVYTFHDEDITVENGAFRMPGTLTIPDGEGPFPAVLLVQGSGPSDRDETIGALKPFRDIAWALAVRGIASLRYDKRTYACAKQFTQADVLAMTVREEIIDDAVIAAKLLADDPRVDASRVFCAGHSLGAMMAPRVAEASGDLFAGLILMSGTPKTLTALIIQQNRDIIAQMTDEATRDASTAMVDAEIAKLDAILQGTPEEARTQVVFSAPAYYFYEMEKVDTDALLRAYAKPMLILQGGEDFQVSPANGYYAYRALLGDATNVTYRLYPALNHPLVRYTGAEEYRHTVYEYQTAGVVDGQPLTDIGDFILAH